MSVHEQFAEDLSLYALGALQGEERETIEVHLETCAACRQELMKLQADVALLGMSAIGPTPPVRSRDRLMRAIAHEPRRAQLQRHGMNWWTAFGWAAAVAAIVIAVFLRQQNADLRNHLARLEESSSKQDQQLSEAKQLLATLTSPNAEQFILVAGKTPPQPQGKAIYVRGSGTLVFLASHMAAAPPHKTHELWLIPQKGSPIPAGLFKPDARGAAAIIRPPLPAGMDAKAFAITIEREEGSSAPTSQPVMIGTGT